MALLLGLCVLFLSSCNLKEERIFLIAPSEKNIDEGFEGFYRADSYGLYTKKIERKFDDVQSEKKVVIDKEIDVLYEYTECINKNNDDDNVGEYYCSYDVYKNDLATIKYLHDSDIICFYYRASDKDEVCGQISENDIKIAATNFLCQYIGINDLNEYVYEGISIDSLGRNVVTFIKYIDEYRTDEVLSVWVDNSGEVSAYNGYNLNKYDKMSEQCCNSEIKKAENAIKEKLDKCNLKDLSYIDSQVVANTSGKLFLEYYISYIDKSGMKNITTVLTEID